MRYLPYIIAFVVIVAIWYWSWRIFALVLQRKGFRLRKTEIYGLLFVLSLVLLAILFSYRGTDGTFVWR